MEALAVLGAAWPRLMTELHGRRLADGTSHGDVSGVRGEDWSSVISAVWIALGMLPLLLLALDAMRKQLWWVYEPKVHHSEWGARAPPAPPGGLFGWVRGVWACSRYEKKLPVVLRWVGFDGLVLLLFIKLCIHICLFASVVGLCLLVPTYLACNASLPWPADDADKGRRTGFDRTTMAVFAQVAFADGHPEGPANGVWASVVGAWLFTLHSLYLIHKFYQQFAQLRHVFLATRLHDPDAGLQAGLSVMVEHVPRAMRSKDVLEDFFGAVFPGEVHSSVVMVDKIDTLNALVGRRERARAALAEARLRHAEALRAAREERTARAAVEMAAAGHGTESIRGAEDAAAQMTDAELGVAEPKHLACARCCAPRAGGRGGGCGGGGGVGGLVRALRRFFDGLFVASIAHHEATFEHLDGACREEHAALIERAQAQLAVRLAASAKASPTSLGDQLRQLGDVILPTQNARFVQYARREERHRRKVQKLLEHGFEKMLVRRRSSDGGAGGASDGDAGAPAPPPDDADASEGAAALPPALRLRPASASAFSGDVESPRSPPSPRFAKHARARDDSDATLSAKDSASTRGDGGGGGGSGRASEIVAGARAQWRGALKGLARWWSQVVEAARQLLRFVADLFFGLDTDQVYASTAFVTFKRATPVLTCCELLLDRDLPLRARYAPETRDLIWPNVHVPLHKIQARVVVTNLLIAVFALFWYALVTLCSGADVLLYYVPGFKALVEQESYPALVVKAFVPIIIVLAILNLLPLLFQALAALYEQRKTTSDVDRSVVERYFNFQLANVYVAASPLVSIVDSLHYLGRPAKLLEHLGRNFPTQSLYFMRFVILLTGSSPLWLLRLWPLLSRGWRTWTREPPSLPGVLYGWVFPKLMMVLIICCTYVVIAPLLAPVALLYFCAISWHFRYLLYYVHIPMYESGGQFWYSAVPRLLFGLTASNLILIGYLMVIGCTTTTPFMLPLPMLVFGFGMYFREALDYPTRRLSLRDAMDKDRAFGTFLARHDIDIQHELDRTMYMQPSLKKVEGADAAPAPGADPEQPPPARPSGGDDDDAPRKLSESTYNPMSSDGIAPARDGERATAQAGSRKASAVGRSLRSFIGRRRADPSDDGASSRSRSQDAQDRIASMIDTFSRTGAFEGDRRSGPALDDLTIPESVAGAASDDDNDGGGDDDDEYGGDDENWFEVCHMDRHGWQTRDSILAEAHGGAIARRGSPRVTPPDPGITTVREADEEKADSLEVAPSAPFSLRAETSSL